MKKSKAIELLGGSISAAAELMGVTYQAVDKWPDDLPPRIAERVLGVATRERYPEVAAELIGTEATPQAKTAEEGA